MHISKFEEIVAELQMQALFRNSNVTEPKRRLMCDDDSGRWICPGCIYRNAHRYNETVSKRLEGLACSFSYSK